MISFFRTIIYEPLYNGVILLEHLLPGADLGVVIILFTLIVKFILLPLSIKATKTQLKMKEIEPELKELKEKYKDDRQTLANKTMELYSERNIKPFSGVLIMLIQIPIIISLYYVFLKGGLFPVNEDLLYSFVEVPKNLNPVFLGLIDITKKSLALAILTGITQFISSQILMSGKGKKSNKRFGEGTMKEDFAKGMRVQMKYGFPVLIAFIAYSLNAAIAIYWMTSNIFQIAQELILKRVRKKESSADQHGLHADQHGQGEN